MFTASVTLTQTRETRNPGSEKSQRRTAWARRSTKGRPRSLSRAHFSRQAIRDGIRNAVVVLAELGEVGPHLRLTEGRLRRIEACLRRGDPLECGGAVGLNRALALCRVAHFLLRRLECLLLPVGLRPERQLATVSASQRQSRIVSASQR